MLKSKAIALWDYTFKPQKLQLKKMTVNDVVFLTTWISDLYQFVKIISCLQQLWLMQSFFLQQQTCSGCGFSPSCFSKIMTQGSTVTSVQWQRLWEPTYVWTVRILGKATDDSKRQPDNLSLPLTHSPMLVCVCMRKSVFMYQKRTVSFKNRRQKNKTGRDKSK